MSSESVYHTILQIHLLAADIDLQQTLTTNCLDISCLRYVRRTASFSVLAHERVAEECADPRLPTVEA